VVADPDADADPEGVQASSPLAVCEDEGFGGGQEGRDIFGGWFCVMEMVWSHSLEVFGLVLGEGEEGLVIEGSDDGSGKGGRLMSSASLCGCALAAVARTDRRMAWRENFMLMLFPL
jgi:hypothetical protein